MDVLSGERRPCPSCGRTSVPVTPAGTLARHHNLGRTMTQAPGAVCAGSGRAPSDPPAVVVADLELRERADTDG
jgi:hypothetical protein